MSGVHCLPGCHAIHDQSTAAVVAVRDETLVSIGQGAAYQVATPLSYGKLAVGALYGMAILSGDEEGICPAGLCVHDMAYKDEAGTSFE